MEGEAKHIRTSIGAYAIIKTKIDGKEKYLLQWNEKWKAYNFIAGHFEPEDETLERTVIRELEEELPPLKHGKDFRVLEITSELIEEVHFSQSAQALTKYKLKVFQLFFLKDLHEFEFLWQDNTKNSWLSEDEIRSGKASDGKKVTDFPTEVIIARLPRGLKGLPLSSLEETRL